MVGLVVGWSARPGSSNRGGIARGLQPATRRLQSRCRETLADQIVVWVGPFADGECHDNHSSRLQFAGSAPIRHAGLVDHQRAATSCGNALAKAARTCANRASSSGLRDTTVTSQKPWAGAWHWVRFGTRRLPAQDPSEVPVERIDPDGLDRQLGLVVDIELATAGGLSEAEPVGSLVSGAAKA